MSCPGKIQATDDGPMREDLDQNRQYDNVDTRSDRSSKLVHRVVLFGRHNVNGWKTGAASVLYSSLLVATTGKVEGCRRPAVERKRPFFISHRSKLEP
eukprot:scaffold7213_cov166-Amphora_coffeaeformis.AAC.11